MKFSIIIPTYNRVNYLRDAILSVVGQRYVDFEIIVIDNASTDGTEIMMRQFESNSLVNYFRNDTNIGMIENWSKALYNYCNGDWVMILSDDDLIIDNDYLFRAKLLIESNIDIVLVHANRIVKADNEEFHLGRFLPEICDGKWMFLNYLKNHNVMYTFVTGIFKKEIAFKVNAFKTFDVVGSDTMEFLKISLYGNIGFIKDFVAIYRIHDNNPYFRFGVDYLLSTNIETFNAPYKVAKSLAYFDDKQLDKWRKRLIRQYVESNFREILIKNKPDNPILKNYIEKSILFYPFCWYIFIKPKALLRILFYLIKKWI